MNSISSPQEYPAVFGSPTVMNNALAKQGLLVSGPYQVVSLRCCPAMGTWQFAAFPLGATASGLDSRLKALNTKTMREITAHMRAMHVGDAGKNVEAPVARGARKKITNLPRQMSTPGTQVVIAKVESAIPTPVVAATAIVIKYSGSKHTRDGDSASNSTEEFELQVPRKQAKVTPVSRSSEISNLEEECEESEDDSESVMAAEPSLEECWKNIISMVKSIDDRNDTALTIEDSVQLSQMFITLTAAAIRNLENSFSFNELLPQGAAATLKRACELVMLAFETSRGGSRGCLISRNKREHHRQACKSICATLASLLGYGCAYRLKSLWRDAIDLAQLSAGGCNRFCNCCDSPERHDALRIEACLTRYPGMRKYVDRELELEYDSDYVESDSE